MIYVHVPFCRSFCTYCDFYSEVLCKGRDEEAVDAYVDAVVAEIQARRAEIDATLGINTLYIGGGTPSVLPPLHLKRIVDTIDRGPYEEFTVEVNPEDIVEKGVEYVRGLLDLGVNRVSMGVQSLDDGILRWMNRRHNADGARRAFATLRAAGVPRISVDVIFGLSQLTDEQLSATLAEILCWRPEHISAYQLSIEEGSALAGMAEDGRYVEASDVQCAAQYELVCGLLRAAGYVHYEISNWALPGCEAVHNSAYWSRRPYVGLGPGAHSYSGNRRSWNSDNRDAWSSSFELLGDVEAAEERIMLGLRTAKGIPSAWCDAAVVERLVGESALLREGDQIRIPEDHFFVSDEIISELAVALPDALQDRE